MKIKCALGQFFVTGDARKNLEKMRAQLREAKRRKADVVVFPECALSGYAPAHYAKGGMDAVLFATALDELKDEARRLRINAVVGTSDFREGCWFNTVFLLDRRGRVAGRYDKLHLTGPDKKHYAPGESFRVFDFLGTKAGVQICFDVRFPEVYRLLALGGAKIVFHPYFGKGKDLWKLKVLPAHNASRAAENGVYIVSCNAAGADSFVYSEIIDPDGLSIVRAPRNRETVVVGMLDLGRAFHSFLKIRRKDLAEVMPASRKAKTRR